MDIYRGYDIVKNKIVGCYSIIQNNKTITIAGGNTVEDAMNKIDSIERDRVQLENEHIKTIDNQVKS